MGYHIRRNTSGRADTKLTTFAVSVVLIIIIYWFKKKFISYYLVTSLNRNIISQLLKYHHWRSYVDLLSCHLFNVRITTKYPPSLFPSTYNNMWLIIAPGDLLLFLLKLFVQWKGKKKRKEMKIRKKRMIMNFHGPFQCME